MEVSLKYISKIKKILINLNAYIIEINDKLEEKLLNFKTNIKLYEYQKNALNEILKERNDSIIARRVITMPPGSGKTIIGIKVIEELKESKAINEVRK